ncbi:fungal mating-type pheromone, partial [Cryptococcus neoformans Tu259-1]
RNQEAHPGGMTLCVIA